MSFLEKIKAFVSDEDLMLTFAYLIKKYMMKRAHVVTSAAKFLNLLNR